MIRIKDRRKCFLYSDANITVVQNGAVIEPLDSGAFVLDRGPVTIHDNDENESFQLYRGISAEGDLYGDGSLTDGSVTVSLLFEENFYNGSV